MEIRYLCRVFLRLKPPIFQSLYVVAHFTAVQVSILTGKSEIRGREERHNRHFDSGGVHAKLYRDLSVFSGLTLSGLVQIILAFMHLFCHTLNWHCQVSSLVHRVTWKCRSENVGKILNYFFASFLYIINF